MTWPPDRAATVLATAWLCVLGTLAISWLTGCALRRLARAVRARAPDPWSWSITAHFYLTLCGLLALVAAYALARTHGRSVLAGVGVVGLALLFVRRPAPTHGTPPAARWVPLLLLGSVAAFSWFAAQTVKGGPFPYQVPFRDHAFYATAARSMVTTGIEGASGLDAALQPESYAVEPYHYLDIWAAAFCSWLGGGDLVTAYALVAPSVFATLLLLGLFSMLEGYGHASPARLFSACLFLFFAPWLPEALLANRLLQETSVLVGYGAVLGAAKLLPAAVLVVAAARLAVDECWTAAAFALGTCAIANVTLVALPAAVVVLLATAGLAGWNPRLTPHASPTRVVLACGLALGFPILFYASQPHGVAGMAPGSFVASLVDPTLARTKLNIALKSLVQLACAYLPYTIALALVARRRAFDTFTAAAAATTLTGLGAWVVLHRAADSVQFFAGPATLVLNAVLWLRYSRARLSARAVGTAVVVLAAVAGIRSLPVVAAAKRPLGYASEYLRAVGAERPQNPIGVFIVPERELAAGNLHEQFLRVNAPAYLPLLPCCWGAVPVVDPVPFVDAAGSGDLPRFETFLFRRFARSGGYASDPEGLAAAQEAFADRFSIDYAIVRSGAEVPAWMARRTTREHLDPVSGDRFVLLAPRSPD